MGTFLHLLPSLRNLDDYEICTSLKNFTFNSKNSSFNPQLYLDGVENLFLERENVHDFGNDPSNDMFGNDDIDFDAGYDQNGLITTLTIIQDGIKINFETNSRYEHIYTSNSASYIERRSK